MRLRITQDSDAAAPAPQGRPAAPMTGALPERAMKSHAFYLYES